MNITKTVIDSIKPSSFDIVLTYKKPDATVAYFPVWDKFHFGDTRIYIPVELPSFCGSITSFSVIDSSAPYHMVIHAVEQFDGKNYLHIEVDIPNDMYDPINYNIRFRIGYTPSGIEESGLPVIDGYEVYPNPSKEMP